jgi:hypothetical protein
MARSLLGAVAAGAADWLLAGGILNPTAAVNEGMLQTIGGFLGAVGGAVIGAAADVVAAIDRNRSPGANGAGCPLPPGPSGG